MGAGLVPPPGGCIPVALGTCAAELGRLAVGYMGGATLGEGRGRELNGRHNTTKGTTVL